MSGGRHLGKLIVPVLSTAPGSPGLGQIYFDQDAGDLQLYVWDGTIWDGLVTTNTAQTIAGQKTFSSQVLLPTTGTTGGILFGTDALLYRGAADTVYTGSGDSFFVQDRLAIGATSSIGSNVLLRMRRTKGDDGSGSQYLGILLDPTWGPTNDIAAGVYGIRALLQLSDATATGNLSGGIIGIQGAPEVLAAGGTPRTWASIEGVRGSVLQDASAGTITAAYGVRASHTLNAAVTSAYGLYVNVPGLGVSATIGTSYGLRIENLGQAGVTTSIGMRMDAQTGATTSWALQIQGGQSYHVGNLRIGSTTAPTVALDVTGASAISTGLALAGITLGTDIFAAGITSRSLRLDSGRHFQIRFDDNSSATGPLDLLNLDSTDANSGTQLRSFLSYDGTTQVAASQIRTIKEQLWTATASTQDSSLQILTLRDGASVEAGRFTSAQQLLSGQTAGSNAATPAFSFIGNPNTGMYSSAADTLDFAIGGIQKLTLAGSSLTFGNGATNPTLVIDAGSGTNPALINLVGRNAGVATTATIQGGIGGSITLTAAAGVSIGANGVAPAVFIGGGSTSSTIQIESGQTAGANAATPAYSFNADSNTGMYSSAADTLNFSTGGTSRLQISGTEVAATVPLVTATSAGAPSSTPSNGAIAIDTTNNTFYYRSGGTWRSIASTNTASGAAAAAIPFTDGDTVRRVTITDGNVLAGSNIIGSVRRPDSTDDSVDAGYIYAANVVEVNNGSFDLLVSVTDWGFEDPVLTPPNETISFVYTVDGAANASRPPLATSLPASPVDGQEIHYQNNTTLVDGTSTMAQLGIVWHLRYNASSSSAYKWEVVGGSFLSGSATGSVTLGNGTYSLTTPALTLPLTGDYRFTWTGMFANGSGVNASYWMTGTWPAGGDADAFISAFQTGFNQTTTYDRVQTGVSGTVTPRARANAASISVSTRTFFAMPIRVG